MCQLLEICNILLGVYTFGNYNKCSWKINLNGYLLLLWLKELNVKVSCLS